MKKYNMVKKLVKGNVRYNVPMNLLTSLRIGGSADLLIDVENMRELKKIVRFSYKTKIALFVLGAGTNILVKDRGIRGIVIRLKKEFEKINFHNLIVKVGAGALLSKLIKESTRRGLSGLECLAGIPGTVGGACLLNAGTREGEIGDRVLKLTCLTRDGRVKKLSKKNIQFKYRYTNLVDKNMIITEVELKLFKDKKENCEHRIRNFINIRRKTQPVGFPNAGCIFKNPETYFSAGALIEKAGLKGTKIGDVEVSNVHANFIINRGRGTAGDVLRLINIIENEIKRKFKIKLEKEVQIIGE